MNNPLVSVLIANYNNGRYLQEAIDSVLAQTYTNWEIVLVDDKSTDNSFEIYEKYKEDVRFHVYFNKENGGCGYTKRRCVELANGEYCGFLDPDDKIMPRAIEVIMSECEKWPKCSVVYSSTYKWDDQTDTVTVIERVGAIRDDEDYLISMEKSPFPFAAFRKDLYDRTEGIDATLRTGVDLDMYLKLEEVGKMHYVDIPLYYYRQNNPNSISGIGNSTSKQRLSINHYTATLNAFVRRIKGKNPLFIRNRERYLKQMRWTLGKYKKCCGKTNISFLKYSYWYWRGNKRSLSALNHLRKLVFSKNGCK